MADDFLLELDEGFVVGDNSYSLCILTLALHTKTMLNVVDAIAQRNRSVANTPVTVAIVVGGV